MIEAQPDAGFESASDVRAAISKLIGQSPVGLHGRAVLRADWIETPLGQMLAVADAEALHLLEFFDREALPLELTRLQARLGAISFGRAPPIDAIETELGLFFGGGHAGFVTPLSRHGSTFFRAVGDAVLAIPFGETRSYAHLAAAIGRPTAVRAVAGANGHNPFAIVVPCHRVIGSDGTLTGYGGGLWRKRWLIEHERRRSEHRP